MLALVLCAVLGGWTAPEPPAEPLTLTWRAPQACPDAETVRGAVRQRVDVQALREPVDVQAEVQTTSVGFRLRLRVSSATTTQDRIVDDPDCGALADAAAVIVAVAVRGDIQRDAETPAASAPPADEDPAVVVSPPVVEPVDDVTPRTEASAAAARPSPVLPQPTSRRRARWQVGGRLGGGIGLGALPTVGPDLSLGWWVMRNRIRLRVPVHWQPRRVTPVEAPPGAGVSISRWAIGLHPCGVPVRGPWEFPICAGLEAGGMVGRGFNLPDNERANVPWAAALANVGVERRLLPWLGISAIVQGHVAFVRPTFVGDTLGRVYRARALGMTATLGVSLRWPGRTPADTSIRRSPD